MKTEKNGLIICIAHEEKHERILTWKRRSASTLIRVMQVTTSTKHNFTQLEWQQLETRIPHACDDRSKWKPS